MSERPVEISLAVLILVVVALVVLVVAWLG